MADDQEFDLKVWQKVQLRLRVELKNNQIKQILNKFHAH